MGRNQRRRVSKRRGELGITGIAWYRREQWARLREVSVDGASLDERYDDWRRRAEGNLRELRGSGVTIRRVDVDVDELLRWCRASGRAVDGPARAAFVAQRLRAAHRGAPGSET
jgi:hypothetical protein